MDRESEQTIRDLIMACEGLLRAHKLTFKRPPKTVMKGEQELSDIRFEVRRAEAIVDKAKATLPMRRPNPAHGAPKPAKHNPVA